MTDTTTIPEIRIEDMPDVDAVLVCEYGHNCPCPEDHACRQPAVWRARMHGARFTSANMCSTFTLLLCDDHLAQVRDSIAEQIDARSRGGNLLVCGCGRRAAHISDVLLEVTAL